MATFITVGQGAAAELLDANRNQTAANRLRLQRQVKQAAEQPLPPAQQINPSRRPALIGDELAAGRRRTGVDVLMIKLRWTTGADYDLNVGFAQSLQYPGGLRPTTGEKLPGFDDYVGWTFFERYSAHNFMYHTGDNTEAGESGEAFEIVFIDLTRPRTTMPEWVSGAILLELRSYWYEEAATTQLELSVYPVKLAPGQPPFNPSSLLAEAERFAALGQFGKQSVLFSTNVGTNKQSGDLGELIATVPVDFARRTWKLQPYQAV